MLKPKASNLTLDEMINHNKPCWRKQAATNPDLTSEQIIKLFDDKRVNYPLRIHILNIKLSKKLILQILGTDRKDIITTIFQNNIFRFTESFIFQVLKKDNNIITAMFEDKKFRDFILITTLSEKLIRKILETKDKNIIDFIMEHKSKSIHDFICKAPKFKLELLNYYN